MYYDVVTIAARSGRQPEMPGRVVANTAGMRQSSLGHSTSADDSVELSEAAQDFEDARSGRLRRALVARMRATIEAATYLPPAKIKRAGERRHPDLFGR